MPIYMDMHELGGVTAEDLAMAHLKDVMIQDKYGVKYLTYWFDEAAGRAFCLVDAPSKERANTVHREAHGLVGNEIIEVDETAVEEFLGKISETAVASEHFSVSQPPAETAFRTILFTDMESSTALTQRLGDAGFMELLHTHNAVIRDALKNHNGREVKHTGDGIMASFPSASSALGCAVAIQRGVGAAHTNPDSPLARSAGEGPGVRVRIGLNAGEPIAEEDDLFGTAVITAARITAKARGGEILTSDTVRQIVAGKDFLFSDHGEVALRGFEDPVRLYEVRWREEG